MSKVKLYETEQIDLFASKFINTFNQIKKDWIKTSISRPEGEIGEEWWETEVFLRITSTNSLTKLKTAAFAQSNVD
jgi:hypothetical protein